MVHKSHFLACNASGKQWVYSTLTGELFIGAHMVLIITQAVMLEQALYQVPKKLGWFKNTEEQITQADTYSEPKKIDQGSASFAQNWPKGCCVSAGPAY